MLRCVCMYCVHVWFPAQVVDYVAPIEVEGAGGSTTFSTGGECPRVALTLGCYMHMRMRASSCGRVAAQSRALDCERSQRARARARVRCVRGVGASLHKHQRFRGLACVCG